MLKLFSIRHKLIILLTSLCILFLAFMYLWYDKSSQTIEKNAIDSSDQLVKQINGHLDLYFKEIERLTLPILAHKLTTTFLNTTTDDPYERMMITNPIVDQLFPAIMLNRSDIFGISLVSNSTVASSSFSFMSAQERYQSYMDKLNVVGKYQVMGLTNINETQVVTLALRYLNTSSGKTTGMIILDIRLDEISKICEDTKIGKNGFVWIADPNGHVIYHPQNENVRKEIPTVLMSELKSHRSGTHIERTKAGKKLIIYHQSELTNLTLVSEVQLNELSGSLIKLRNITLVVGGLMFVLAFIIAGVISVSYTNSILTLQRLMKRAEIGDLSVRAPEKKGKEMGKLFHGFNNMVFEIRRLIEVVHIAKLQEKEMEVKQKESIVQVMQSKINPHFLYNTLEVINSYAIVEGVMPISRMATSLADFFRYSVGNPSIIVTMSEEITHITTYLDIQKERYEYLLVDININEEMASHIQGIRLMLQPIVENAFKHGYDSHKIRPDYIGLYDEVQQDNYCLYIKDKGKGMASEIRDMYNSAFRQTTPFEEKEFSNIGLWNVHQRISLMFGENYGLYIVKSDTSGTTIQIQLPFANKKAEGVNRDV